MSTTTVIKMLQPCFSTGMECFCMHQMDLTASRSKLPTTNLKGTRPGTSTSPATWWPFWRSVWQPRLPSYSTSFFIVPTHHLRCPSQREGPFWVATTLCSWSSPSSVGQFSLLGQEPSTSLSYAQILHRLSLVLHSVETSLWNASHSSRDMSRC